jgi:ribosomal protein L37AE/L43A
MNRVQFQRGLSMPEFLQRYGTEAKCQTALEAARWPHGFECPACGGAARTRFERGGLRYWQCGACEHQCSLISGTIFEATKLPLSRWFLAMQLLTQSKNNVSALELKRQLGVSYPSAWLLKHKIMEAMRLREQRRELDGRVEIDDAYLGGEHPGGKVGRGSENKIPFVAAVQTTPEGLPEVACLRQQPLTKEEVAVFAAHHIAPTATVVSDGMWGFLATQIVGAKHVRVITGGGRGAGKVPQFKAINTLLSNLKTAIGGTYHAFDFGKYAHRYLAEFQFRFNRRFNMRTILERLLIALATAPASPEHRLRRAEVHC